MLTGTLIRRVYLAAVAALILMTAGGVLSNGLFFAPQPYQLNYGEGLVAWQAAHITDPSRAYAPIDRYPFVVFQYPPLFHLATRAMAAITHGDLLTSGRSVSLLSAVILCFMVGWTVFQTLPRRAGTLLARLLAAFFAGTLPTTLYNFNWTSYARVDTLAILLSFAGVVLFAARCSSAPAQIVASVLMIAALFTRQTTLAGPLACLLVAWAIDRKIALRMLLTMSILGASVLAFLEWWSHGQIILHLFRYNQNPFSIKRAVFGLLMNTRHIAGLLVLAGGASMAVLSGCWSFLRRRAQGDLLSANLRANSYRRGVLVLAVYSLLAGVSVLAFGKEGSDINYFLEWNISLAPLAGIMIFRAIPKAGNVSHRRPALLAALAIPLLLFDAGFDQARDGWLRMFGATPAADRQREDVFQRMLAEVRNTPGPVFSEDMNLLYKSGKDIPADPAMIQCLAAAGIWNQDPFVRLVEEHSFGLIVAYDLASRERYSQEVAAAIDRAYIKTGMIGEYRVYRPQTGLARLP